MFDGGCRRNIRYTADTLEKNGDQGHVADTYDCSGVWNDRHCRIRRNTDPSIGGTQSQSGIENRAVGAAIALRRFDDRYLRSTTRHPNRLRHGYRRPGWLGRAPHRYGIGCRRKLCATNHHLDNTGRAHRQCRFHDLPLGSIGRHGLACCHQHAAGARRAAAIDHRTRPSQFDGALHVEGTLTVGAKKAGELVESAGQPGAFRKCDAP
jgi:hypothetical protein